MDNFRVITAKVVYFEGFPVTVANKTYWRGENFPTPDELAETAQQYLNLPGDEPAEGELFGLIMQERRRMRMLGRTVLLPLWKNVKPEVIEALMFLDEPEF
jgi:hypothetical protein